MVAYNFKPQFVPLIETGAKQQTIRSPRKRHTQPGEAMQLYTGMRTKACRKLVTPDPLCISVEPLLLHDDIGHQAQRSLAHQGRTDSTCPCRRLCCLGRVFALFQRCAQACPLKEC